MKKLFLTLCIVLTSLSAFADKGTIVLRTPQEYQIMYISANGKWATGVYYDYSYNPYAFRWNLESGKIELLSSLEVSVPSGISDDGVVIGQFSSTEITGNGAPVSAVGYYDNKWHTLPFVGTFIGGSEMGQSLGGGISGGISPDGKWMAGSLNSNGALHPVVWHNGEFYKNLWDGCYGVPYCISPDGQSVAGWKYIEKGAMATRYAAVWRDLSKNAEILSDYGAPWCTGQMFSADGKKLLLWGGITAGSATKNPEVTAIYDMATHKTSLLETITEQPFQEDFNSIANDGTILGFEQYNGQRATIYKDGKGYWATDYLKDKGIWDFYNDPNVLYVLDNPEIPAIPQVIRGLGISADAKAMGFFCYEPNGYYQSCVVLTDQELTHRAPCGAEAKQFDGMNMVRVSWLKPLVNAENVDKYVIYRNGVKIAECTTDNLVYFDSEVSSGTTYEYTVSAIYKDATESDKCAVASVSLKEKEIQTPYALVARQNGFNNATFMWTAPRTNKVVKTYYDAEIDDIFGFGAYNMSFELAVRYDKNDFKLYEGTKIEGVSFYPMSTQMGWKATVYEYDEATDKYTVIKEEKITQDLVLNELNTVTFKEPITIDAKKDIVVGITATVSDLTASNNVIGMTYGKCIPGKTDLLRLTIEPKLYSFYELRQEDATTNECTWAINLIIDNDAVSADADKVSGYNIYADGALVKNVAEEYAKVESLSEGKHTLGVEAVYADGSKSNVQNTDVNVDIDANKFGVNFIRYDATDASKVKFSWVAPQDNDRSFVAYCSETPSKQEIRGNKEENYALQALAIYEPSKLRPYVGTQIKSFRFYPTCDAEFTLALILNDNIIAYEEVMDYTLNQWNEVELEEPISILPGLTYQLVLDCYDTTPEKSPIGIDNTSPFTDIADLVTTDGQSFQTLSYYGIYGNFMMGLVTESTESTPLPIAGYNVYVDGELKTQTPITVNSFEYDMTGAEGKHNVNVEVVFDGTSKIGKGAVNDFYIGANAIQEVTAGKKNTNNRYYDIAGRRINKPSSTPGMFIDAQKKQKTITSGHQPLNIR